MIQDVGNVEQFELFETDPRTQCKSPMWHAYGFVPHECCTARACVVAGVRLVSNVSPRAFCSGGREGA